MIGATKRISELANGFPVPIGMTLPSKDLLQVRITVYKYESAGC